MFFILCTEVKQICLAVREVTDLIKRYFGVVAFTLDN